MTSHRPFALPVAALAAAVLLPAVAGCSPTDAAASVPVPSPPAEEAGYCRALHDALPQTLSGFDRSEAEPESDLTAAWGDGAIVLRCGVPRPEKMSDPQASGLDVNGVGWLLEVQRSGAPRFTSTYRKTYVEVTLDERFTHDSGPLIGLAEPVAKTVPKSL
ncbi:DUF3515 domain-containing protein [Streptomyces sp. NPDC048604]|uniref:DUF3515 domain-containing protein n=1 Tax=Streptomyces sp. NPDC048604 TaxID=3365578 RepID=UPI003717E32D